MSRVITIRAIFHWFLSVWRSTAWREKWFTTLSLCCTAWTELSHTHRQCLGKVRCGLRWNQSSICWSIVYPHDMEMGNIAPRIDEHRTAVVEVLRYPVQAKSICYSWRVEDWTVIGSLRIDGSVGGGHRMLWGGLGIITFARNLFDLGLIFNLKLDIHLLVLVIWHVFSNTNLPFIYVYEQRLQLKTL